MDQAVNFPLTNRSLSKTLGQIVSMVDRISKIRESVVRIKVDGKPSGRGFVVSEEGLIATVFMLLNLQNRRQAIKHF